MASPYGDTPVAQSANPYGDTPASQPEAVPTEATIKSLYFGHDPRLLSTPVKSPYGDAPSGGPVTGLPDLGGVPTPQSKAEADQLLRSINAQSAQISGQEKQLEEKAKYRSHFLPYQSPETGVYIFDTMEKDRARLGKQFEAMPDGSRYNVGYKQYIKLNNDQITEVPEDQQVLEPVPSTPSGAGGRAFGEGVGPMGVGLMAAGSTSRAIQSLPLHPVLKVGIPLAVGLGASAGQAFMQRKIEERVAPELVEQERRDAEQQPGAVRLGSLVSTLPFFRPGLNLNQGIIRGNLMPAAVGAGVSGAQSLVTGDPDWLAKAGENAAMFGLMGRPTSYGERLMGPPPRPTIPTPRTEIVGMTPV